MCGGGDSGLNLNPAHNPIAKLNAKLDLSGSGSTVLKAFQTGNWGEPLGAQASGWDVLGAGPTGLRGIGGSSDNPRDRAVGRAVGSLFAGEGLGQAAGAGVDAAAANSVGVADVGGDAGAAGGVAGGGTAAPVAGDAGLGASASSGSGLSADAGATGTDGTQILSASDPAPTYNLSPETSQALGITPSTPTVEADPGVAVDPNTGFNTNPTVDPNTGFNTNPGDVSGGSTGTAGGGDGTTPGTTTNNAPSNAGNQSPQNPNAKPAGKTIMGLKPSTAALLGIAGVQALTPPKQSAADKSIEATNTPAMQEATAVISSGGTSGPAWAGQKQAIDSDIDQQIEEQIQAIVQQAINSGQGADSLLVKQQVAQLKDKLETQRQTLYSQQQQKNVQAALNELGISNQALSNVSANQFNSSAQAKQQASQTASTALLLQALG